MDPRLVLLPAIVFVVTVVTHLLAIRVFPRLGLLDFPQRYGLSRARLPYPTGILLVAIFLITFALLFSLGMREWGLIIAIVLLAIVSFVDDRTPLPFWLRLSVQVLAAVLIFAAGSRIYTITNPLGGILKLDAWSMTVPVFGSLPVLSGLFTIGWLMLAVNALNWFDGISGQVSTTSTIGFLLLGCLAYFRNDQPDVALLAFVLAAIALACVFFDFPPAKVLMGDSGSMFFGFMLGVLGIYQGGKVAMTFVVLGIPLVDAVFVIARRVLQGKSPFKGDNDHLHHRLLAKGLSKRTIVVLMATISATLGASALFLGTPEKAMLGVLLVVIVGMCTVISRKSSAHSRSAMTD